MQCWWEEDGETYRRKWTICLLFCGVKIEWKLTLNISRWRKESRCRENNCLFDRVNKECMRNCFRLGASKGGKSRRIIVERLLRNFSPPPPLPPSSVLCAWEFVSLKCRQNSTALLRLELSRWGNCRELTLMVCCQTYVRINFKSLFTAKLLKTLLSVSRHQRVKNRYPFLHRTTSSVAH